MSGKPQTAQCTTDAPSRSRRPRKRLYDLCRALPAMLGILTLAAALTAIGDVGASPQTSRFSPQYFTDVPVTTHEGKTLPFYEGLIKDKKVVINFIYLNCNDICPLQTSRMAQIRLRLGEAVGRDFFIYSITMDPEHDTPELLKEYAEAFGGGGGWQFLTGNPADLEKIRWQLGERSRELYEHRNDMVLGNDATGEWSRSSVFEDFDVAVTEIRQLDPVYFNAKHAIPNDLTPSEQSVRLDGQPGEVLFMKACSTCHSIGGGNFIGPDLKHIAERRDRDWLTRFMMEPNKMRAAKDPLTLELLQEYKGVRMPNLGLKQDDVSDLLQYIEARSAARDRKAPDAKTPPAPHNHNG